MHPHPGHRDFTLRSESRENLLYWIRAITQALYALNSEDGSLERAQTIEQKGQDNFQQRPSVIEFDSREKAMNIEQIREHAMSEGAFVSGWLSKRNHNAIHDWKQRWFVLRGVELLYADDETESKVKVFPLRKFFE